MATTAHTTPISFNSKDLKEKIVRQSSDSDKVAFITFWLVRIQLSY